MNFRLKTGKRWYFVTAVLIVLFPGEHRCAFADGDVETGTDDFFQDAVRAIHIDEEVIICEKESLDAVILDDSSHMIQYDFRLHGPPRPLMHDRIPTEAAAVYATTTRVEAYMVDTKKAASVMIHIDEMIG